MQLSPQREMAARREASAAIPIITDTDYESRSPDPSADDQALTALRRNFAPLGLSVYRLLGRELMVTGAGLSRSLPDDRCAWVLLRHLKGGTA